MGLKMEKMETWRLCWTCKICEHENDTWEAMCATPCGKPISLPSFSLLASSPCTLSSELQPLPSAARGASCSESHHRHSYHHHLVVHLHRHLLEHDGCGNVLTSLRRIVPSCMLCKRWAIFHLYKSCLRADQDVLQLWGGSLESHCREELWPLH